MLLFRGDRLKEAERTRSNIKEGNFSSSFFFLADKLVPKKRNYRYNVNYSSDFILKQFRIGVKTFLF